MLRHALSKACVVRLGFTARFVPSRTYQNFARVGPKLTVDLPKIADFRAVARVKIHTTRRLDIPPALALLIRPLVNIGAFLFGRYFKRWWARQTPEQREMYRRWFVSKKGVFLGIFGAFLSSLGIYYVRHLETDPLTNRSRFILLNKEQQDALAKFTYETACASLYLMPLYNKKLTILPKRMLKHLEEHQNNLVPPNHPAYVKIAAVTKKLLNANKDLPFVKDHTWTLNVVNSDTKNAYVLPGGHIFVFLGTLNMVDNEDQLAIILSHEMAHVLLKHPIEQVSNGVLMDLLLAVPLALLWATFPDVVAFLLQSLGKTMLAIVLSLPYSRSLEREADEVGLNLAAKACVDVREAVVFWGTMKALVDMKVEPAELPWLSTHPDNAEREKFLDARIPNALELRMESGCLGVHRVDPRKQFKERSLREQQALLKARGYSFV